MTSPLPSLTTISTVSLILADFATRAARSSLLNARNGPNERSISSYSSGRSTVDGTRIDGVSDKLDRSDEGTRLELAVILRHLRNKWKGRSDQLVLVEAERSTWVQLRLT
jgi:hypothetical protein